MVIYGENIPGIKWYPLIPLGIDLGCRVVLVQKWDNGTDPPKSQMETDDQPLDGVPSPRLSVPSWGPWIGPIMGSTWLFDMVVQHGCSTWLLS